MSPTFPDLQPSTVGGPWRVASVENLAPRGNPRAYAFSMPGAVDEDGLFLDAAERRLVEQVFAVVDGKRRAALEDALVRLRSAAELVRDSPSIGASFEGEATEHDLTERAFADALCQIRDYDLELHVPTKTVLGQAYLVAKIHFLKALGRAADSSGGGDALTRQIEREVGQSIYTKLAEELFVSIVTDPSAPPRVKTGAARFLLRIWEERLLIEVDDFAPILESVWEARSKLLPVLGTMLGTHEIAHLVREARDHRFLDYFGEGDVPEEQLFAFEELLFGLSHEEITRLRAHLEKDGQCAISPGDARVLLGNDAAAEAPARDAAQALYTSYKKRRLNAVHRALTGTRGPKKTAEEYVTIAFLSRDASPSAFPMKAAPATGDGAAT